MGLLAAAASVAFGILNSGVDCIFFVGRRRRHLYTSVVCQVLIAALHQCCQGYLTVVLIAAAASMVLGIFNNGVDCTYNIDLRLCDCRCDEVCRSEISAISTISEIY